VALSLDVSGGSNSSVSRISTLQINSAWQQSQGRSSSSSSGSETASAAETMVAIAASESMLGFRVDAAALQQYSSGAQIDYVEARTVAMDATLFPTKRDEYIISNAFSVELTGVKLPEASKCAEGFVGASARVRKNCVSTSQTFEVANLFAPGSNGLEGALEIFIPYTGGDFSAKCAWFDTPRSRWSTDGCAIRSTSDAGYTCHCSHLTTFALISNDQMSLSCSQWSPAWRAMGGAPFYSLVIATNVLAWTFASLKMGAWFKRQWFVAAQAKMQYAQQGQADTFSSFFNAKYESKSWKLMGLSGFAAMFLRWLHDLVAASWLQQTSGVAIVCSELGFGDGRASQMMSLLVYPMLLSFATLSALEWHPVMRGLTTRRLDVSAEEVSRDRVVTHTTQLLVFVVNCVMLSALNLGLGSLPPSGSGASNDALYASAMVALLNVGAVGYLWYALERKHDLYNVNAQTAMMVRRAKHVATSMALLSFALFTSGAQSNDMHSVGTLVVRMIMLRVAELALAVTSLRALQMASAKGFSSSSAVGMVRRTRVGALLPLHGGVSSSMVGVMEKRAVMEAEDDASETASSFSGDASESKTLHAQRRGKLAGLL